MNVVQASLADIGHLKVGQQRLSWVYLDGRPRSLVVERIDEVWCEALIDGIWVQFQIEDVQRGGKMKPKKSQSIFVRGQGQTRKSGSHKSPK